MILRTVKAFSAPAVSKAFLFLRKVGRIHGQMPTLACHKSLMRRSLGVHERCDRHLTRLLWQASDVMSTSRIAKLPGAHDRPQQIWLPRDHPCAEYGAPRSAPTE